MSDTGISIWLGALIGALATSLNRVVAMIPALLGAIVILLIGWLIGRLVGRLVERLLLSLQFNSVTENAGINSALSRADVKVSPARILGIVAAWFIYLIAIQAAVNVLGIEALTVLMTTIVLYLPRVLGALLIVIAGAWVGSLLAKLTRSSADAAGVSFAGVLGSIVQGFVIFFAFAIALDMLGFSFPFVTTAFAILLGAFALASAIAFGLGGREYASDLLAGRELRSMFHGGENIKTDNYEGKVTDIGPTMTVVQTPLGETAVRNSELTHLHATRVSSTGEGGGSLPKAA